MRTHSSSRQRRFLARFTRAERGATAVEFALVSVPILMLIFGLLEIAMVFLVGATLDQATQSAGRLIRTGEFQTGATGAAITPAGFKNLVCQRMTWLQSQCASNLFLDVQTYTSYANLAAAPPLDTSTFDPSNPNLCFKAGNGLDIVLVRAYYQWTLIAPVFSVSMQNMGGGKRLINSATAFRNEPYNNLPPVGQACH